MRLGLLAAVVELGACAPQWTDGTSVTAEVTTSISEASASAFKARVRRDVELWSDAIASRGCPAPFRWVDSDADGTVRLVDKAHWHHAAGDGIWVRDRIDVLSEGDGTLDTYVDDPRWIVVLHELGHSMGLEHVQYTDSIMCTACVPEGPILSKRDVDDALVVLGCGL